MPLALTYWVAREPGGTAHIVKSLRRFVSRQIGILIVVQGVLLFAVLRTAPGYERTAAAISLASIPAAIAWQYGLGLLQGQRRFVAWNMSRLVYPLGYAITISALYLGHVDHLSVVVICWTSLLWLAAGSSLVAAHRPLRGGLGPKPNIPGKRVMLRFGLKALLGSVSPIQSFNLDQAIVGLFISPIALGIYVVGVSFTNLPYFIAQSVGAVAYPNIAASTDRRHLRRTIVASASAVLILSGMVVVPLEALLPWLVPLLFGTAFKASVGIARVLLLYGVLAGMRRVLGDCARGAGLPALSTLDELSALLCLVPSMLVLVGHGITGVAWAMVISASVGLSVVVVGLLLTVFREEWSFSASMSK